MTRFKRFVGRLSKLTGADIGYLVHGAGWTGASFAFSSLLALALQVAFANLLSKESYGNYRYILSVVAALSCLSLTGMSTAITKATAQGVKGVLIKSLRAQLRWNSLMSLALLLVAAGYYYHGSLEFSFCFFVLALTSPLASALGGFSAALVGNLKFKQASLTQAAIGTIYSAVILVLVIVHAALWQLIVIPQLLLVTLNLFFFLRTSASQRESPAANDAEGGVDKFAVKLSAINLISILTQNLDKIVLQHGIGPAEVAGLAIIASIPERSKGLLKNLGQSILPKLSAKSPKQLHATLRLRIWQSLALGALCTLPVMLLTPLVFEYLFRPYNNLTWDCIALCLEMVFTMPGVYLAYVMRAREYLGVILSVSLAVNGVRMVSYIALGPIYGISAVVLVKVITAALGVAFTYALVRKRLLEDCAKQS